MKPKLIVLASTMFLALVFPKFGWAQQTNFAMMGITNAQTLQLNLVAFPPSPCIANLGFQDSNGNPVGPSMTGVTLAPGQYTSLTLTGLSLTKVVGQRVEVLPMITPGSTAPLSSSCIATAEVVEDLLENTTAFLPAVQSWPPGPVFGMIGLTVFETARLNVVAYPPNPCIGTLSFANSSGGPVGKPLDVDLAPGQAAFTDLPGSELVSMLGQRAEIQPMMTLSTGGLVNPVTGNTCVASTEVYITLTGETAVYFPPNPCSPTATSCAAY